MGLAPPRSLRRSSRIVTEITEQGRRFLLVEQNAAQGCCGRIARTSFSTGEVVREGRGPRVWPTIRRCALRYSV